MPRKATGKIDPSGILIVKLTDVYRETGSTSVTFPITPEQIRSDLRGQFSGSILIDPVYRGLYSTDASPFQVQPWAVAIPEEPAAVPVLLRYCFEHQLPLVARGAGTGLAGESLGSGIILDLSQYLRRIVRVDSDTITVEPGVTLAEVNTELAKHGRRIAPDPASAATCTIGGMIATNASGSNAYRYGYLRDYVQSLSVVWDSGDRSTVSSTWSQDRKSAVGLGASGIRNWTTAAEARVMELRSQTAALLMQHRDLIERTRPQIRFNRCGYVLHDVMTPAGLDLAKLFTGSEGTLGVIIEATLRTVPLPGAVAMLVLGFPAIDAALRAGLLLRTADGVVSCDLLDPRQLAYARSLRAGDSLGWISPAVGAALIISLEAETRKVGERQGQEVILRLRDGHRFLTLAGPTCDLDGLERICRFRQAAVNGLYALGSGARPVAAIEDLAVPAEELPRFVAEIQQRFRRYDLAGSFLVHVLTAQVHARPFIDLSRASDRANLWAVAEEVYELVLKLGGTISTQHGTGLARTPWVEKQYGPLMPVFRELKRIFDPKGILNPGKIIGPDPSLPAWPFRYVPSSIATSASEFDANSLRGSRDRSGQNSAEGNRRLPLLSQGQGDWPEVAVSSCNGCGDCRTRSVPNRMCPLFHATGGEAATPRAKVNLFRQFLQSWESGERVPPEELRAVADLCVNCKMCRTECRASVDVPKLMLEAKAADHAERGFDRTDWMLARVELLSLLAGNFALTTNLLLGHPLSRWFLEQLFGLSRHRRLPRFTHRTFLRRAHRAGWTRKPTNGARVLGVRDSKYSGKLAYFTDIYANYNDPLIGEATVAVLRYHGFDVHVPRRQRGSGMPALAAGDAETAKETAIHNVRILADLVRDGYQVICSEPTATLALTQDYLDLADDADTRLVAENTFELTGFLWQLHQKGRLHRNFRRLDLDLGHHIPCHMKALRVDGIYGPQLLELIPGVRVHIIDRSCSGMAGVWGLKAENFALSLAAGQPMIAAMKQPRVLYGSTECSPCRLQMQQGSGKRTLHPIQYLALAYGLMPELARQLKKPLGSLLCE